MNGDAFNQFQGGTHTTWVTQKPVNSSDVQDLEIGAVPENVEGTIISSLKRELRLEYFKIIYPPPSNSPPTAVVTCNK